MQWPYVYCDNFKVLFTQEFFNYLADKSGYDIVDLTNVGHLQSVLYIEVCIHAHITNHSPRSLLFSLMSSHNIMSIFLGYQGYIIIIFWLGVLVDSLSLLPYNPPPPP